MLLSIRLLYFDVHVSHLLKNKNWQIAIDPTVLKNNWYLDPTNQRKYANNGKNLLIVAFIFSVVVALGHVAMFILERYLNAKFRQITSLIVSAIIATCVVKLSCLYSPFSA